MKIKKKLLILLVTGTVSLLTGSLFSPAWAQKPIEWKVLSSWGTEYIATTKCLIPLLNAIQQKTAGRLKVSWVGPEAVPTFEQFKPLREGLFDMLITGSGYHQGEIGVANAADMIRVTNKERRSAGIIKILDEVYRKKANVLYFSAMSDGGGYQLMLKNKISKADFTGLKLRGSPFYDPLTRGLNGAPVRLAGAEIYSALEKGVIDGAFWSAVGIRDYKWYEVAKYLVRPIFGEAMYPVLVNGNSWNRLPKDIQDILNETAIEMEDKCRADIRALVPTEEKELQKLGMELLFLQTEEAKKYINTWYERTWEEIILKSDPVFGPRLKEAVERIRHKSEDVIALGKK